MIIRILSDLHTDVNSGYPLELKDNNIFTIIAGDVSGSPTHTIEWVDKNIKQGILVSGNHITYNTLGLPLQSLKQMLATQYPVDNNITFLDYDCGVMSKEINGILFIGTTLYTDYKYENTIRNNMNVAEHRLNDFRYGFYRQSKNRVVDLRPCHYRKEFKNSFNKIKEIVEQNKDKEIVIVTHHCPSPKCIDNKYMKSSINASYTSNLEKFIIKNPNIKCWICGHVHNKDSFKIGNCLVVFNPRGYERLCECDDWTPDFFLDTDTWTISSKKYTNEEWENQRQQDLKYYNRLLELGFF
jgi:Icc-related predicted phosphoesterase